MIFFLGFMIIASGRAGATTQCNHIEGESGAAALEQRFCLLRALKNQPGSKPSNTLAITYRAYIQSHSEVGYDLVLNWDRFLENPMTSNATEDFEAMTGRADQAMLKKDFQVAFDLYSDIETKMQKLPDRLRRANLHFRLYILHSMARALYGLKQFDKAFIVYSWIPSVYPNYRQVLFEQMWTSFNLGRIDVSLGALASQRSSYFGKYLEPESYLVWVYILRKLCRGDEINTVRGILKNYQLDLKQGRYGVFEWAKSDPVAQSWANLIRAESLQGAGTGARGEADRINKLLRARFDVEKKRLIDQLQKVDKFSYLALDAKTRAFPPTKEVRSYTGLLKLGFEMWPGADAEDWLDEVGRHRFIGESRCQ
jgi:hypothetical protein